MGWSFRKAFRLLPGIRLNLSRRGPRLSVGVPGLRASVGMDGKTRIYGGKGPLRYRRDVALGSPMPADPRIGGGLMGFLKKLMS